MSRRFEIDERQSVERIPAKRFSSEGSFCRPSPLLSLSAIEPRIICDDVTDRTHDVFFDCKITTGSRDDDGRATKEIKDNGNTKNLKEEEDALKTKERSRLKTKWYDEGARDSSGKKSKGLLCLDDEYEYDDEVLKAGGQQITPRNVNAKERQHCRGHYKAYDEGGFVHEQGQSGDGNEESDRQTKKSQRKVGKSKTHSTLCLIS